MALMTVPRRRVLALMSSIESPASRRAPDSAWPIDTLRSSGLWAGRTTAPHEHPHQARTAPRLRVPQVYDLSPESTKSCIGDPVAAPAAGGGGTAVEPRDGTASLVAAKHRDDVVQFVRFDEHIARLGALARADDAATFHQVHQPARFGEAHP